MAETNKSTTPQVILAGDQHARQQFAEEMKARNADPLDESKREGGFFLRGDGTPVDAFNDEIPADVLTADEKAAVKEHRDRLEATKPRTATPAAKKRR